MIISIRTKLSYYKVFMENLLAIEMTKSKILMNKPVYLGLSILDLCKTVIHEFCYDYLKPKYGENVKICYMDRTASLLM